MISKHVLKQLINVRLEDALVLFKNRRYQAALYMSGYAIEIALKLKICLMFSYRKGFPETKTEFSSYKITSPKSGLGVVVKEIKIYSPSWITEADLLFGCRKESETRLFG